MELLEITSHGDRSQAGGQPLYEMQPQGQMGVFTKELEQALLDRQIDLAVHSLKDLPTLQPPELVLQVVPQREASNDVLIINAAQYCDEKWNLPLKARVGSSSLRRQLQLRAERPELEVISLRGNVETRIAAAQSGKCTAVVLAQAGLNRLAKQWDGVKIVPLPEEIFVPAPGQGALGIETHKEIPSELKQALAQIHDEKAAIETKIERQILRALEGGCSLPLGVRCWKLEKGYRLHAFLGTDQGASRFDFSTNSEQTLVAKTIEHFKGK